MKAGMAVTYLDGVGGGLAATVLAITGTLPAGKVVSLRLADGQELHDVPHEKDAAPGAGCWRLGPPPAAPVKAPESKPAAWEQRPRQRRGR